MVTEWNTFAGSNSTRQSMISGYYISSDGINFTRVYPTTFQYIGERLQ